MDRDVYAKLQHRYQQGCVFCDPAPELVLFTTENFGVCLDVAPLVPGHVLIHSREHHGCAGEVPEETLDELAGLKDTVGRHLEEVYGTVGFFEHGRAGHCLSDGPEHRLCHHYHLHCVPTDVDITATLSERFARLPVADYRALPELYAEYGDYLYTEPAGGEGGYFVVDQAIERHLLRTLVSTAIGRPERADWRRSEAMDLLRRSLADLQRHPLTGTPE